MTRRSGRPSEQALEIEMEGTAWVTGTRVRPRLGEEDPATLLEAGKSLGGNARYAVRDRYDVVEIAEVPLGSTYRDLTVARTRIAEWLDGDEPSSASGAGPSGADESEDTITSLVESSLDLCGLEWSSGETGWTAAAGNGMKRGMRILKDHAAIRVDSLLFEGEVAASPQREALALFLLRSQGDLRFARFSLEEGGVRVASVASIGRLEDELPRALGAVAASFDVVAREIEALLDAELAAAFLEHAGRALAEAEAK